MIVWAKPPHLKWLPGPLARSLPAFGKRRLAGRRWGQVILAQVSRRLFTGVMDCCSLEFVLSGRPLLNRLVIAPALTMLAVISSPHGFEITLSGAATLSQAHLIQPGRALGAEPQVRASFRESLQLHL